jgi:adenosyl cobinamide kinase/adenosyl cobinamide phosphate guanylyltransferase
VPEEVEPMITLVLGGTRSGKSEVAESLALAGAGEAVTYVATGRVTDGEMADRIATHRARRPPAWATVEAGADLPAVLARLAGAALVDSLGTWVAGLPDLTADPGALCAALRGRDGDTIVVSEEVGMGVHPPTAVGRAFADALGSLNRSVAAVADAAYLVVAGRLLPLDPPPQRPPAAPPTAGPAGRTGR